MSNSSDHEQIMKFLSDPVPPGGTLEWQVWQQECKSLGDQAPRMFLEAVTNGCDSTHDAALIGLHLHGYEVQQEGFYEQTRYRIKLSHSDTWIVIRPKYPPRRLSLDDYGIAFKPKKTEKPVDEHE